jgi:hypothetical protein
MHNIQLVFSGFNEELCKMRTNGIYETEIPLVFRAILKLGATSRVKSLNYSPRIDIDQMERIPYTEMPYVKPSNFRVLYFYEFTSGNRTAFALFDPSKQQAHLCIVNHGKIDAPNVNAVYKKEWAKL